jgi:transcriptional regulator with XRE-family HTH domain
MEIMPDHFTLSVASKKSPATRGKNIVGPQIRKLRNAIGWSQAKLAARLQLDGLDISREVLAQMESQFHCIKDNHIFHFACVLKVRESEFFICLKNEKSLRNHNNASSAK